jgi:CubicO group peptidase (beta-lactamase class C family)
MIKKLLISLKTCFAFAFIFVLSCGASAQTFEWQVSTPIEQGLNDSLLNVLDWKVIKGDYKDIHSLLIIKNDYIVFERYYSGHTQNELTQIFSATKSVTSALIGIAIHQGKIKSPDDKLLSFFPEYKNIKNRNNWKKEITLRDVLTMSSGFEWDEYKYPLDNPDNPVSILAESPDWIKYMLDRKVDVEPGTKFNYTTGNAILLSGILQNTTYMTAEQFAKENLFSYLGITDYRWLTGPHGLTNTGWGLFMKPRDMAKFGLLYLHNGIWNGNQIVSTGWIDSSTSKQINVSGNYNYGYQWWDLPIMPNIASDGDNFPIHLNEIFFCWGYGGQFIFVIPDLDMVVVSTAGNMWWGDKNGIEMLYDYIIPAVKK